MKKSCLLLIILHIILVTAQGQQSKQHRYPKQTYVEDSAHVYWDSYPNPFSPPTITDSGRGVIKGELTFYCDISDSVEVAFITKNDSIVHKAIVHSSKPPYFSVSYWVAGPHARQQSLPISYFKPSSDRYLRLVIIVAGRWKSIRERGIPVREGWHYWIDTRKPNK